MNALYAFKAQPGGQLPEVLPEFELVIDSVGAEYDLESDAGSDSAESDDDDDQWEDEEDGDERPRHRESALEEQYRQMERINSAIRYWEDNFFICEYFVFCLWLTSIVINS